MNQSRLISTLTITLLLMLPMALSAQVAINSNGAAPHPSAMLDIQSDSQGLLMPRMGTTDRNSISSPAEGLMVYDTDYKCVFIYHDAAWQEMIDYTGTAWFLYGDSIYTITRPVGIGLNNPKYRLDIIENNYANAAAVQVSAAFGPTKAFLGIQGQDDFAGETGLDLQGDEIGMLGLSTGSSLSDNVGVYGYSNGIAGKFAFRGNNNYADLGTQNYSAYLHGKVYIDSSLYIRNQVIADSSLYVTDRLGVGTNSPLAVLHVKGGQNTTVPVKAEVMYTAGVTVNAIEGIALNYVGRGRGVYGEGGYVGVEGIANGGTNANISYGGYFMGNGTAGQRYGLYAVGQGSGTNNYGVAGAASSGSTANYAGHFQANGTTGDLYGVYSRATGASPGTNFGIYAKAQNATVNWAGYFEYGDVYIGDEFMVGVTSTTAKAHVKGNSGSTSPVMKVEVAYTGLTDVKGIEAVSEPAQGYGIGVYGKGSYRGVQGEAIANSYSGFAYGGYFTSSGSSGARIAVYGSAYGTGSNNYGIYGSASGGVNNWAGYFLAGDVKIENKLQVGVSGTPSESIHVKTGGVRVDGTTANPSLHTMYGNTIPIAYGYVSVATLAEDYGVTSVSNPSTGKWEVVLDHDFNAYPVVIATPWGTAPIPRVITYDISGTDTIIFYMSTLSGTAATGAFSFVIFGEPY